MRTATTTPDLAATATSRCAGGRACRAAFTLVELLVVIAIIGILIALLLPAVQAAREAARRTQCANNMKQLGLALINHHDSKGAFPIGVDSEPGTLFGFPRTTWMMHTFPYLEAGNVHRQFDFDVPAACGNAIWMHPNNFEAVKVPVASLVCPSDGRGGPIHHHPSCPGNPDCSRGNYAGFFGNLDMGAALPPTELPHLPAPFRMNDGVRIAMVTDGTSQTMMLGECLTGTGAHEWDYRGVHWYDHVAASQIFTKFAPNAANPDVLYPICCQEVMNAPALNLPCVAGSTSGRDNTASSRSRHPGGVQVTMGDGSIQFVSESIDITVWQAMGSVEAGDIAYQK